MRPLHRLTSLLVALLALLATSSCSGGGGSTFTQASGKPNEVMPAMPQVEEQMDVTTVDPKDFDTFLRYVRNILIVDIDAGRYTQNSVKFAYDQWAHGQIVVTIQSPSPDSVCSRAGGTSE